MERTLIWKLAYRYLRGKRTANAVPILSRISMVAIAVSSAAMIIIFSVFNGLELAVKDLYTSFYPDIKITAAKGKFFSMDTARLNAIKHTKDAVTVTPVIEDNVMANNGSQQIIITVKGIENSYFAVNNIRQYIVQGEDSVSTGGNGRPYTAIAGLHILNELGTDLNALSYVTLYYPNPDIKDPTADPLSAFQSLRLHPAGIFRMEQDFDAKYMLAPLSLVQELFHAPGKYSSLEVSAPPGTEVSVKKQVEQTVGPSFRVETRYEQNRSLYVVMGAEKWAVCAILVMVLLIASFNMLGALSMLVLEKQKDIAILKAMGAQRGTIRKIFLLEGMLWSLIGGAAGLIIGCGTCLLQQKFGFVKLGGDFLVDAYPVKLQFTDILLVLTAILSVGLLISWYPAMRATKAVDPTLKST